MKADQMSDEQVVAILQEAEKGKKTLSDHRKEKGISENSFNSTLA